MIPTIYVYGNDVITVSLMKHFEEEGFAPLSDTVNDYQWKLQYFKGPHKFFQIDYASMKINKMMDIKNCREHERFHFAIAFKDHETVEDEFWIRILDWVMCIVVGAPKNNNYNEINIMMERPYKEVFADCEKEDEEFVTYPDCYGYRGRYIEDRDLYIYEVTKPFTDLPYTTVTPQFSEKGHKPFFTSLFICSSWGVANSDIQFLYKMWKYLEMEGECNLEEMYKERVDNCYPAPTHAPEPEPVVYRRPMEVVLEQFHEKETGRAPEPKKVRKFSELE
jgi:hypothetical protein